MSLPYRMLCIDDAKLFLSFHVLDSKRIVQEINEDLLRMRNWCFEESRQVKITITVFGIEPTDDLEAP